MQLVIITSNQMWPSRMYRDFFPLTEISATGRVPSGFRIGMKWGLGWVQLQSLNGAVVEVSIVVEAVGCLNF